MKEFVFPLRVYVEDTDYGGIVYHSVYLNYMERCRTEWLNHLDIDIQKLGKEGCLFLICHVELDYLKPAALNTPIEVTANVGELGRASLTFNQTIRNRNDRDCTYCKGQVKLVTTNHEHKPIRLPQSIVEKFR